MKKRLFTLAILVLALVAVPMLTVRAAPDVTITPATGGTGVSIDTTSVSPGSGVFTSLTGPAIAENLPGDIGNGLHRLVLPGGWAFDTSSTVTIVVSGSANVIVNYNSTPSSTYVEFSVTTPFPPRTDPATLTFSGLKVRPTVAVAPTTGYITHLGIGGTPGVIAGVTDGVTSFGTLSTVPGAVSSYAITTHPSDRRCRLDRDCQVIRPV